MGMLCPFVKKIITKHLYIKDIMSLNIVVLAKQVPDTRNVG